MRGAFVCWCAAAVLAVAVTLTWAARAQSSTEERNAARALAVAGREAFRAGEYEKAIERLRSAEKIHHAPAHLLYMARAHDKLGRLVQARELYRRIVDEELPADRPAAFRKAQGQAREELAALEPRIPSVSISVDGAPVEDVRVIIDGEPAPVDPLGTPAPLDPGEHEIVVRAAGRVAAKQTVTLVEGTETQELHFELRPAPPGSDAEDGPDEAAAPTGGAPVGGIVLLVAGGASLIAGIVTGALALDRADELHERCPPNPCPPENEELEDEATTLATISTVTFAVGGVAVAAGAAWLLFGWEEDDEEAAGSWTLRPQLGPVGVGVHGTF